MDDQLFVLLRSFFSLSSLDNIEFPMNYSPKTINEFLVHNVLLDQHFQYYPPSHQYQRRFWKWAIQCLEDRARKSSAEENDDFEIDPRIYNHYLTLIPLSGSVGFSQPLARSQIYGLGQEGPPSQSYITHFWDPGVHPGASPSFEACVPARQYQSTTLLESRTTIESGTTGLRTWLASFALAQYLILHPEIIASKRVLELGSGIGFLGIIVASLQLLHQPHAHTLRPSLWLTDGNDQVLSRCHENVNLPCNISHSHPDVNYLRLDWSESIDPERSSSLATLIHERIDPELILGADVAYDPSVIPSLVGTLKLSLRMSGNSSKAKVALIALTVRNVTTMNEFLTSARESSLVVQELDLGFNESLFSERIDSRSSCENIKLFHIS